MPRHKSLRKQLKIEEASPEEIKEILNQKKFNRLNKGLTNHGLFSVKLGGELVAWAKVGQAYEKQVEIERLEVLPKYERKGIGKKILGRLNAILLRRKINQIILKGTRPNKKNKRGSVTFYETQTNFKKLKRSEFREAQLKKRKRR
jgi:GNAT superfamily N-acetyltransferase